MNLYQQARGVVSAGTEGFLGVSESLRIPGFVQIFIFSSPARAECRAAVLLAEMLFGAQKLFLSSSLIIIPGFIPGSAQGGVEQWGWSTWGSGRCPCPSRMGFEVPFTPCDSLGFQSPARMERGGSGVSHSHPCPLSKPHPQPPPSSTFPSRCGFPLVGIPAGNARRGAGQELQG